MIIPETLIDKFYNFLGEENLRYFKHLKGLKGNYSPVLKLNPKKKFIPFHPVHFREGMQIRNWMRSQNECLQWDNCDFDKYWTKLIELTINYILRKMLNLKNLKMEKSTNDKIEGNNYKERNRDQLNKWVNGNSIHNKIDDECCPDFSCCRPDLLWNEEKRLLFKELVLKGDKDKNAYNTKIGMLMEALGNAISTYNPEKKVHITDGDISIKKDFN